MSPTDTSQWTSGEAGKLTRPAPPLPEAACRLEERRTPVCAHTHTHGRAPRVVVCHHWPARSQPGCLLLVPAYEVRRAEICKRERSPAELLCSLFPPFLISGGRDVGFHSAGAAASSLRSSPLAAKADGFHSTSPSRPLSSPSLMVISISEDGLHRR